MQKWIEWPTLVGIYLKCEVLQRIESHKQALATITLQCGLGTLLWPKYKADLLDHSMYSILTQLLLRRTQSSNLIAKYLVPNHTSIDFGSKNMLLKSFLVISLASAVIAQFIPENVHNVPDLTAPISIATSPPSPDDTLGRSLASEASAHLSSINSAGMSAIASITSEIGSQASQISSKLDSVSSQIASRSSSYSNRLDPSNTGSINQAAPAPTGAIAIGALFGIGALVANY